MTLTELIAKVEKATGPDREIDSRLHKLLVDPSVALVWGCPNNDSGDDYFIGMTDGSAADYTASLDACMALIERVLPDWWWSLDNAGKSWDASVNLSNGKFIVRQDIEVFGSSATAPLSLLLAALRALEANRAAIDAWQAMIDKALERK